MEIQNVRQNAKLKHWSLTWWFSLCRHSIFHEAALNQMSSNLQSGVVQSFTRKSSYGRRQCKHKNLSLSGTFLPKGFGPFPHSSFTWMSPKASFAGRWKGPSRICFNRCQRYSPLLPLADVTPCLAAFDQSVSGSSHIRINIAFSEAKCQEV